MAKKAVRRSPKRKAAAKKPARRTAARRTGGKTKSGEKNSLVANINRRKKAGKSRSKAKSTISDDAYEEMQKGWPDSGKKKSSS